MLSPEMLNLIFGEDLAVLDARIAELFAEIQAKHAIFEAKK